MTSARFCTSVTMTALAFLFGREGLVIAQALPAPHISTSLASTPKTQGTHPHLHLSSVQLPMAFEADKEQKDRRDGFLAQGPGYRLCLSPREATFQLARTSTSSRRTVGHKEALGETLTMRLVGADASAHAVQDTVPTGHANYFLGKDRSQWHTDIPLYDRVEYRQVYKGIDLVYYGNQRQLEYDFLVRAGTDPKRIALKFAGARRVRIATNGDLVLGLTQREVRWHRPLTYQMIAGKKRMVASSFVLKKGGEIGFALARYDTSRSLTIDPKLIYSTLLGGHNFFSGAEALAVDSAGNTYVAGRISATDFPVTSGAFQQTYKVDLTDPNSQGRAATAFVAKLNPAGTAFLYATYLGGSGSDMVTGIAIGAQGNAYVTGTAASTDFPVTTGAFQTTSLANRDRISNPNAASANFSSASFVTKLNPTGSALIYSTYLSGHLGYSEKDTTAGIAVDAQGSAYVTGVATSLDFPTTPGAFQTTATVKGSGFLTKLNPAGSALSYSTYLAGSQGAECHAITVDSAGNAYVTGHTNSIDFPTTPGSFEPGTTLAYPGHAFITKMNPAGAAPVFSTYLGAQTSYSEAFGIAIDTDGNVYTTGKAVFPSFPDTPAAFQRIKPQLGTLFPRSDAFVTKLNAAGAALVYSVDLGFSTGLAIAVDDIGSACVTGNTQDPDFPTTVGAFQRTGGGIFVTRLNAAGTALLYSTYMGGSLGSGEAVALDNQGNATVSGYADTGHFFTTPNAFQQASDNPSQSAAFATRLSTHPIFPDFNTDGSTDLLFRNRLTGVIGTWYMNGPTTTGGTTFSLTPPATYSLIGAGDFLSNGSTTLVFQDSVDNRVVFWYTGGANNAVITGGDYVNQTPGAGWKLVGVTDFNQDGRSDLLFQNQTTGQLVIWNMSGPYYQSGLIIPHTPAAGWKVVGTGDFNGDGFADIAFQNQTTGKIEIWFMQGTTYMGGGTVASTPATGWNVVGVGDYNGDGYADLLFQNQTTNQAAVWYMNGTLYQGGSILPSNMPTDWKIVGPH
jgi:hypothetical protein